MRSFISGDKLRDDLLNLTITRQPLIDEFIFERDIFLLSSDSGAGKSIFSLNLLASLSFAAGKRFLGCKVMRSAKTLYIQLEGDYEESIERLREMEKGGLIIDEKNVCIVEEKTLNVSDESSVMSFLKSLNDIKFNPEVIIIDPIYKLCHGDISKGEFALAVIRFSDILYNKYHCTNILIHHNTKDSYAMDGSKIQKDDSFYGHSFIKNHVRTSYQMKITGENKRQLLQKKGRGSDTIRCINIEYDPDTFILNQDSETRKRPGEAVERILSFIQELGQKDKTTNSTEVMKECDISYARLRHVKQDQRILNAVKFEKTKPNNREIWIPKIC